MSQPTPKFDDLTREVILDHYRKPRHRGKLEAPTLHLEGMNPVCGDEIKLDLLVDGERFEQIAFKGNGCSISVASASMLAERLTGKPLDEGREVLSAVRALLTDGQDPAIDIGDLEALEGVAKFPARVKCALLSWNVLEGGLDQLAARRPGETPVP